MNAADPLELAWRLGLVALLAVFMGLAFEETYKREDRSAPGGIRTFPMLALGGLMLYLAEPHYAAAFVVGLLALGLWLYAALKSAREATLMIPASNLLAYSLGPVGLTQPTWIVIAVSVIAVLLLGWRERLHGLIKRLPQDEVLTAGKFLILVGVILPLAPDRQVVPFVPLTPYQVWLAVVAVCALSYLSYLIQRYVPIYQAALLPAVLGGIYSSTATTIVLAKQQRDADRPELAAGIVAATAVMFVRLGIVVALFDRQLALALSPALAGLFVIGAVIAWLAGRGRQEGGATLDVSSNNPLQIQTAVIFAVLFVVISVVSAWTKAAFGSTGLYAVAAAVGVTDIDPYVINIAQGGVAGMPVHALGAAILIAASSNNIMKAAYTLGFGGVAAGRRAALLLLLLAALGLAAAGVYAIR